MDTKSREQLLDVMIDADNIEAVAAIINESYSYDWQNRILQKHLIAPLKEFAKSKGLEMKVDNMDYHEKEAGFGFRRRSWAQDSMIYIGPEKTEWRDFFIGINCPNKGNNYKLFKEEPNEYYPFGWEYLDEYRTWDIMAMPDMVKGRIAAFLIRTIEKVLNDIDVYNISL